MTAAVSETPLRGGVNSRPGEQNGASRVDVFQVCAIRAMSRVWGMTNTAIAAQFGLSREAVRDIVNRKSWPHVPEGQWTPPSAPLNPVEVANGLGLQDVMDMLLARTASPGRNGEGLKRP